MEPSYISLGDMLAFIGLIVAVYQLQKPRYALLWKLSNSTLKTAALALLIAGYLSPLAAVLAPDVKNIHVFWTLLSLSQLFQVAGFVFITFGALVIAYIYSRFNRSRLIVNFPRFKLAFHRYPSKNWRSFHFQMDRNKIATTRSARKFYEITSTYLVRGHVEEVVEIIYYNLKPLVHSAQQYIPEHFQPDSDTESKPLKANGANYTFETLYQLLTDEAVMRHICTNNRPFLHAIVWCETAEDGWRHSELARVLYPNIVEHLVLNNNSFVYTQKNAHYGSARFANIYDLLTDEKIIRRQRIIPSQLTWHVTKTDVPLDAYTGVLAELLERMIESYKRQPGNRQILDNIRAVLDQTMGDDGVLHRMAFDKKARKRYADDIANSVEANVLRTIQIHIVHNLFRDDDPDSFKANKSEINAENKESIYDQTTLTGLVAHKIYEHIEDLIVLNSDVDDPDAAIRREMFDYLVLHVNTPVARRYEELLYERLFDKAVHGKLELASNIQGYYPNVLRHLIGFLAPFKTHLDDTEAQAQTKMKSIMANELKEVLLKDMKMIND
jgi:hypothetical protein